MYYIVSLQSRVGGMGAARTCLSSHAAVCACCGNLLVTFLINPLLQVTRLQKYMWVEVKKYHILTFSLGPL